MEKTATSNAVTFFKQQLDAGESFEAFTKSITVRLDDQLVFMADVIAKKSGVSRSNFCAKMIECGIKDILDQAEADGDDYLTWENLTSLYLVNGGN